MAVGDNSSHVMKTKMLENLTDNAHPTLFIHKGKRSVLAGTICNSWCQVNIKVITAINS